MNTQTKESCITVAIILAIIVLLSIAVHADKVAAEQDKRDAIACGEAGNQWREVSPNQFACLTNQKGN